ncbi:MAG: membrane protein insertion efficiency factor YidD [Synergistaceae bacterium]|nr:membrane protein insertion efficiency factor YidD [Synergistaceae bacterium]
MAGSGLEHYGKKLKYRSASIPSRVGISLIRGYQAFISPLLGHNCRFYPSCSQYAVEALAEYGFFKGIFMATVRICKCAPWHPGGYDPVPPRRPDGGA